MNKIIEDIFLFLNKIIPLFKQKNKYKYLFILSSKYCGSTLLNEFISTSKEVSSNNNTGTREGQTLPTVRNIMFKNKRRWDPGLQLDWKFIKSEWHKHWDSSKKILLEKSPPNIVRAVQIQTHFKPSFFIILHRNPYAQCESLIRRKVLNYKIEKLQAIRESSELIIKHLKFQIKNTQLIKNHIKLSYEELTDDPNRAKQRLSTFLSELIDIEFNGVKFKAHNHRNSSLNIMNLNAEKIAQLSKQDIEEINKVFEKHRSTLAFFGYKLIRI